MIRKVKHLYVHIPFCNSICTYCDFVRYVRNDQTKEEYVNKIIEQIKHQYKNHKFSTIYIGGGTPNCLNDDLLNKLLCTLSHYLLNKYEFTIECNPELITDTQIRTLKQNKVNRVSIGVQSINDSLLRKIHRKHTLIDVKKAIDKLRKFKINNISIDLIYGFNEQTLSNIKDTCTFIKKHKIPHVS
jgi:oxygen-independent coproporphyrinogen-3 oxidase